MTDFINDDVGTGVMSNFVNDDWVSGAVSDFVHNNVGGCSAKQHGYKNDDGRHGIIELRRLGERINGRFRQR